MDSKDLRGIALLDGLDDRHLNAVAQLADHLDVERDAHLITEGAFAHEFFIILDGQVEVAIEGKPVTTLGPGDFFGEVALLRAERRTASCTTITKCRIAVLSKEAFEEVELEMPSVAQHLREAAAQRMSR